MALIGSWTLLKCLRRCQGPVEEVAAVGWLMGRSEVLAERSLEAVAEQEVLLLGEEAKERSCLAATVEPRQPNWEAVAILILVAQAAPLPSSSCLVPFHQPN